MADDAERQEPEDPELVAAAAIRRWSRRVDIAIVVLLGAASFLAAWAGYQAGLWAGRQNDATLRAEEFRSAASRASIIGFQERQVDIALFIGWLEAYNRGDTRLTRIYEARFTRQLQPAFAAWMATDPLNNPDAPLDPFRMADYEVPQLQQAAGLEDQAGALVATAQWYDAQSEAYIFVTLLLAVVLFFGGVSTKIGWRPGQVAMLLAACALFVYCLWRVVTMPGLDDAPEVTAGEPPTLLESNLATPEA